MAKEKKKTDHALLLLAWSRRLIRERIYRNRIPLKEGDQLLKKNKGKPALRTQTLFPLTFARELRTSPFSLAAIAPIPISQAIKFKPLAFVPKPELNLSFHS